MSQTAEIAALNEDERIRYYEAIACGADHEDAMEAASY
jgi:hypothetical protein